MGVTPVIIGVLFLLSIVSNIAKGRIRGGNGYADRSASPVPFWLILGLKCVVVLAVLFPKQSKNIVQFGIQDTSADTQGKVEEFKQRKSAESETSGEQELRLSSH